MASWILLSLFYRLYVAGKRPKFYAVSLLDRKEVTISLGRLDKGSVLVKRTARIQVRLSFTRDNVFYKKKILTY